MTTEFGFEHRLTRGPGQSLQNHDPICSRIAAAGQRGHYRPRVEREGAPEGIGSSEDLAIPLGIPNEEDHALRPSIPTFAVDVALERLEIVKVGLTLDSRSSREAS
jgi:hypothetical protein